MNFVLLGRSIPLYGIFFWAGIFAAASVAALLCKKRGLPGFDLAGSAVYTLIGAIVGAKLLYLLVSWREIAEFARANGLSFAEMLPIVIKGGFVFYGGLIGGFIGLVIYARQFKMKLMQFLDVYAIVVPLGHAFGRVGCFFAGCCYGIPYNGLLAHTYHAAAGAAPTGVTLFPVQLLEALCLLLLFAFQVVLLAKRKHDRYLFVLNYAISYSLLRFALEFLRGDSERGGLWVLSTSQWISLAVFALAMLSFVYVRVSRRT